MVNLCRYNISHVTANGQYCSLTWHYFMLNSNLVTT